MLLSDTKIEINYGHMSAKDYVAITTALKQLIQHLGAMDTINFPHSSHDLRLQISGISKTPHIAYNHLDSVDTLVHECLSDLQHIAKFLKFHSNFQSEISRDISKLLQDFDSTQYKVSQRKSKSTKSQTKIAKNLHIPDSCEEMQHVYFWIFNLREFVKVLSNLVECISKVNKAKSLHFPLHLWSPAKSHKGGEISSKILIVEKSNLKWTLRLYNFTNKTKSQSFRFATKLALAVTGLLLFIFFPSTSAFFFNYRGEWAVVSVITVLGPTANYTPGIYRIIGTVLGGIWAVVTWYAVGTNPYGIWPMVLVFVAPVHYLCFSSRHAYSAFVSVLTLLIIILSKKFNVDMHSSNTDEIYLLAYKRVTEGGNI